MTDNNGEDEDIAEVKINRIQRIKMRMVKSPPRPMCIRDGGGCIVVCVGNTRKIVAKFMNVPDADMYINGGFDIRDMLKIMELLKNHLESIAKYKLMMPSALMNSKALKELTLAAVQFENS